MGVQWKRAEGWRDRAVDGHCRNLALFCLLVLIMVVGAAPGRSWAMQKHDLTPEQGLSTGVQDRQTPSAGHGPAEGQTPAPASSQQTSGMPHGAPDMAASPGQGTGPAQGIHGSQTPPQVSAPGQPTQKVAPAATAAPHPPAVTHEPAALETAGGHGGGHGPKLPEISPIPGVTFVETMIKLLDHELNGRFLGWRPNDIIIGRFTDNINNFQLGVLEALRHTTLRLKDSLTRMGDADTYDPDLEQALNLLMNSSTSFWFPSAESSYGQALDHLRVFQDKLKNGQRNFYYRKDNLILLIATYKDLLGNINRNLIRADVSWFKTDDYFYYAQGVAHVYYEILRVVRAGYQGPLTSTMNALEFVDEIIHELGRTEVMDPWIILDSDLDGFFANHRANLNAPLSEVAHLLGVLSQF